ncbi:MAG: AbrB family transcriptional regulator [Pseudomonadota bacterium]
MPSLPPEEQEPTAGTPERLDARRLLLSVGVAAIGGLAAQAVGFPAGLLAGAMAATAAAALFLRLPIVAPDLLRRMAFFTVGATIGATVSQETLATIPTWPISLAGLAIGLASLLLIAPTVVMFLFRFDRRTAVMSAVPGAFSFVLAFSHEIGADVRRVAVIQTLRLAGLFIVLPIGVGAAGDASSAGASLEHSAASNTLDVGGLIILAGTALVATSLARRARVSAPEFIAPLIAGLALSGGGIIDGAVPTVIAAPAFIATGLVVGARFVGVDTAILREALRAAVIVFAISLAVTAIAAGVVAGILDEPFAKLWLAFAPGGLDTMSALALALGHDPAFVAGHQLVRFLALNLLLPIILPRALA